MPCAQCPPSMSSPVPAPRRGTDPPVAVDPQALPYGYRMLPYGEPTILLRVDPSRISAGLPAVVIRAGEGHRDRFTARAIHLLGESCLGPVDGGVALSTSAAIEVI